MIEWLFIFCLGNCDPEGGASGIMVSQPQCLAARRLERVSGVCVGPQGQIVKSKAHEKK